ncbi:MAG: stage III sporulation protein AF, partial [Clostridia bacterium]|nr:stage III sporulation protein AF [Clostridia bacterium]
MNVISTWVLSVAGISMLAVLVDLILPLGQTKKYIKGVFALIVVVVVITPIFNLFKSN